MGSDGTYYSFRIVPRGLFEAWLKHYRALGLAHLRASHYARKRCAKGKFPP